MRRTTYVLGCGGVIAAAAVLAYQTSFGGARREPLPREADGGPRALPLAQVVLFNSGVGYFQREGTVDGDAHVDLPFPATEINDLLKSLVFQDLGQGTVSAVSYDSHEPIERTLKSFALDLTGNPNFGQILNQARGEKVELALQAGGVTTAANGEVVGMESQADGAGKETHLLNLLTSEGLRSIPLSQVQRIRFLNPALERDFRGALGVLAAARDSRKKMVNLHFRGAGKRNVRVGYVVESPLWKTSYRLVFDKAGKLTLQNWAVIENTTDEDWKEVRLALVSGRPLSFAMDLYQPLFVPRPKVEPELFASLRPPAYSGALLTGGQIAGANVGVLGMQLGGANVGAAAGANLGAIGGFGLQGGFGGAQGGLGGQGGFQGGLMGGGGFQGTANLGVGGGAFGQGGQNGQFGGLGAVNRYQIGGPGAGLDSNTPRLSYEELQKRRHEANQAKNEARTFGSALAAIDPKEGEPLEAGGDTFEHVFDQKLTLPRQKSALLRVMEKEVQGQRVSIFNAEVHGRLPLLGLKFKNTTGKPLMQGPVMVYEGGRYAGDARILDLQPDEQRLLAFALDLGVEVKTSDRQSTGPKMSVRMLNDELSARYTLRKTRSYLIRNRSHSDRVMIVEHPIANGWALAADHKPSERTRDHYRFEVPVPAGQLTRFEVAEEQVRTDPFQPPQKTFAQGEQTVQHYGTGRLGVEVERLVRREAMELMGLRIAKGQATSLHRQTKHTRYRLRNVSGTEREVVLEHHTPIGHTLVGGRKPIAGSTDRYLFQLTIAPGQVVEQAVAERTQPSHAENLRDIDDERSRPFLSSPAVKEQAKAILREGQRRRSELQASRRLMEEARSNLKKIVDEQGRLRANLERLPPASAAYKRYLEKFDTQETQIEKLQAQIDQLSNAMTKGQKEYEEFLASALAD